jgi:hypothetical protein
MGRFGSETMSPEGHVDAARAIDDYAELAEVGVSWTPMSVPAPSIEEFIDNIQRFGEEIIAKTPGRALTA